MLIKYHDDLELALLHYREIKANNFRELVEKAFHKGIIPQEFIREAHMKIHATFSVITANYVIIMTSSKIKKSAEESETSALIRKMFFGILMARLFLMSAIYADAPLSVLPAEIYPQGYFKIPKKLGLRPILMNLKLSNESWVPLDKVDEILEKLAALLKAEEAIKEAGYGKDTLLEIATRHPGMVLARAAQSRKILPKMGKLIQALDHYWRWKNENFAYS